jgi:microcin C transport system substrate-binding protein
MRILVAALGFSLALCSVGSAAEKAEHVTVSHGLSIFGDLKYGPDFKHFDYADPDAPKGGAVVLSGLTATYDSLNPYIVKGTPASGVLSYLGQNLITDSLLADSHDEPFSEYGLIAKSVTIPADRSWVEFNLRDNAHWNDGSPITVDDVIFTFDILKEKGLPLFRNYYANVAKVEKTGPRSVRFTFNQTGNNELPTIVGQMPVLPKKYWENRAFDETTLDPPLSSGPYKIVKIDPGRSITYQRDPNYWGKDLPVNKGRFNIDTIRYDYYRDSSVILEAFKAGKTDFRYENSAKQWATGYDVAAVKDGRIIRQAAHSKSGEGYQGFLYNLRRNQFQDPKVREALDYAYDFTWTNKTIFYGLYAQPRSYFEGTELAATGLPSPDELKLLEPFKAQLDPRVFTEEYNPPETDGTQESLRKNLRIAARLMAQAGWVIQNGKMISQKTGEQFSIQILNRSPADERVVAPFVDNLKLLGIDASFRMVDETQYISRVQTFDFDMTVLPIGQSLSPGNEQRDYWGSDAADREGSHNYMGIKSAALDSLINDVIFAKDRQTLITATHALDRVLQWGFYSIPEVDGNGFRYAFWNKFGMPRVLPDYAEPAIPTTYLNNWWIDPAKERALQQKGGGSAQ